MQKVECYCLFDITATGVTQNRATGDQQARNQQRNWDTMMQLVGMRTQVFNVQGPEIADSVESPFVKDRRTWKFTFEIEPEAQWLVDGDEFWVLKQDSDGTPMITGLTESGDIEPIIRTSESGANVIYRRGHK
jgi:hypothetical protein